MMLLGHPQWRQLQPLNAVPSSLGGTEQKSVGRGRSRRPASASMANGTPQYLRNSSELHHNGTGHRTSPFNSLSGTAGVYAPGTSCLCELLERQPIFILDYKLCGTVMTLQRSVLISSPVLERQSCWYVAVRHDGLRTKSSARPLSAQGSQMFSQRHGNGSLDPAGIDLGQGNSYDLSDHGNKKLERSIRIRPASAGGLVGVSGRSMAWQDVSVRGVGAGGSRAQAAGVYSSPARVYRAAVRRT